MARPEKRRVDLANPVPGPYLVRLVPRGWQVAAKIMRDGDLFQVEVDGARLSDRWTLDELPDLCAAATIAGALFDHPLFKIVLFGKPCDEATYRHRLAMKEYCRQHQPDHPCLSPLRPIDQRLLPAVDF